jgi:hypothetical protein
LPPRRSAATPEICRFFSTFFFARGLHATFEGAVIRSESLASQGVPLTSTDIEVKVVQTIFLLELFVFTVASRHLLKSGRRHLWRAA